MSRTFYILTELYKQSGLHHVDNSFFYILEKFNKTGYNKLQYQIIYISGAVGDK